VLKLLNSLESKRCTIHKLLLDGAEALDRCRTSREQGKELRRLALLYAKKGMFVRSATGIVGVICSVDLGEDPFIRINWASGHKDTLIRLSETIFIEKERT
jgi:hypothetical protein